MGIIFTIVVITLTIFSLVPKLRDKLREALKKLKDELFWNGVLRSLLIAYLPQLNVLSNKAGTYWNIPSERSATELITIIVMTTLLFAPIVVGTVWLKGNKLSLDNRESILKYGNLYEGLSFKQTDLGLFFVPFFLLQRFLAFSVKFLFFRHPVTALCIVNVTIWLPNLIYYGLTQPHVYKRRKNIELFNLWMLECLFICYLSF